MQRKPISAEDALTRLESLCARSEHSSGEIVAKLRQWGVGERDTRRILESLKRDRFVDDERFARAFAVDKMRFAGHGKMKIRMGLITKGVPRDLIDDALAELDDEEYRQRLLTILRAKMRSIDDVDSFEGRTKLFRFAASRGFESALISQAIKDIFLRK